MDWHIVKDWLIEHGYTSDIEDWEYQISENGIYAKSEENNDYISAFGRPEDNQLMVYVGSIKPKLSEGGLTGQYLYNIFDVINYLHDELERIYDDMYKLYSKKVGI